MKQELVVELVSRKKLLLLVDEAQELARNNENERMAMALRTAIIKNSDKLRVVFAGSSRTQLANVFSNSNAPLFRWEPLFRNFLAWVESSSSQTISVGIYFRGSQQPRCLRLNRTQHNHCVQ